MFKRTEGKHHRMAGDWIKMREDLHEDPAVIWIAQQLDVRPEVVVGYCHKFWGYVSRQTADGCLRGVAIVSLGNVLSLPGFPELLVEAGWLEYDESDPKWPIIRIPKFERHLSEGAKTRAVKAEQKRLERSKNVAKSRRQMSPKTTDKMATREEKRRDLRSPPPLGNLSFSTSDAKRVGNSVLERLRRTQQKSFSKKQKTIIWAASVWQCQGVLSESDVSDAVEAAQKAGGDRVSYFRGVLAKKLAAKHYDYDELVAQVPRIDDDGK